MNHFQIRECAGLELLVCEPVEDAGFLNAFTARSGGVSPLPVSALNLGNFTQDTRENILENRRRLLVALEIESWPLATLRQIHSADIIEFNDINDLNDEPPSGDALLTDLPDFLLAVQTADCLPILLADRRKGAVAAIHAGWRGTLAGVVSGAVRQMEQRYGTDADSLLAVLGPAIGPCCFEVGPDVVTLFREQFRYADQLISRPQANGKVNFDLNMANRLQLRMAGVADQSIFDSNTCTVCQNHRFFSYRFERGAERPVGRLMGVIGRSSRYE